MRIFTVDSANNVRARASNEGAFVEDGAAKFVNEKELAALAANWSAERLVEIWHKLPGVKPVRKFTDRKTAVHRIWRAIRELEPRSAAQGRMSARRRPGHGEQTGRAEQTISGPAQTKTDSVIALLKRPSGATLKAIMAETGWQSHSVRGFISAQLSKRMGFRIQSFKRGGERVYRIRT